MRHVQTFKQTSSEENKKKKNKLYKVHKKKCEKERKNVDGKKEIEQTHLKQD